MTDEEIRIGILRVCKVASWDSDFNVVGFHALCDKLKELGAADERDDVTREKAIVSAYRNGYAAGREDEREACSSLCDAMVLYTGHDCAAAIRARSTPCNP